MRFEKVGWLEKSSSVSWKQILFRMMLNDIFNWKYYKFAHCLCFIFYCIMHIPIKESISF